MTAALSRPTFPADGAPISVLLDFDGTISLQDVGDALLARFAPDQDEVARMDRLYDEGVVGSRELMRWDMDVLPRDPATLVAAASAIALDPTLVDLVGTVRAVGGVVEVVSDGIGFHVQPMLDGAGLGDLPIATNATVLGVGGAGVSFPYGHPACHVCGTCKRERVRAHQAAERAVVFVGDGASDRYAAHHADVVFANASLARYCEGLAIAYEPWRRLGDVAAWLTQALEVGALPASAADFPAWVRRARPGPETFICGPESWGPAGMDARAERRSLVPGR